MSHEDTYKFVPCCISKPHNGAWDSIKDGFELPGSACMRVLATVICSAFGDNIFICIQGTSLLLGKDIFMESMITDYVHNKQEPTKVFILQVTYSINPKYRVFIQNAVYNSGQIWPPADNFDDVCPINLEPIGQYDGYGRGPCVSDPSVSNLPANVLVIEYSSGHRRAYNKASYCRWVSTHNTDPLTNTQVSNTFKTNLLREIQKSSVIPFHHFYLLL